MAIPLKDSLLVQFSTNFSDQISAAPATFGFTGPIAASFATQNTAWVDAYNTMMTARSGGQESKILVSTKNAMRAAMLTTLRVLDGAVQSSATVSDANKFCARRDRPRSADTDPGPWRGAGSRHRLGHPQRRPRSPA